MTKSSAGKHIVYRYFKRFVDKKFDIDVRIDVASVAQSVCTYAIRGLELELRPSRLNVSLGPAGTWQRPKEVPESRQGGAHPGDPRGTKGGPGYAG